MRKDLNRTEIDELILQYNFVKNSIRSFARKYSMHHNTVARFMDELNLPRKRSTKTITNNQQKSDKKVTFQKINKKTDKSHENPKDLLKKIVKKAQT